MRRPIYLKTGASEGTERTLISIYCYILFARRSRVYRPCSAYSYSACSASFFSRNSIFPSQQFSRNNVFGQFQPSFRPANGPYKNIFCNTFQPMRKSYLNCIANMLFNYIHVQSINMLLKYFISI